MSQNFAYKPADLGGAPEYLVNGQDRPLFVRADIEWSRPSLWEKGGEAPLNGEDVGPGCIYAIIRDHPSAKNKQTISYIGLTTNLPRRFRNHQKAKELADRRGPTLLSVGKIEFKNSRRALSNLKRSLEEIEHLFIWALWDTVENKKKAYALPGISSKPAHAWHILNTGHRFAGRMPREIVYPWILIKAGRDRSART